MDNIYSKRCKLILILVYFILYIILIYAISIGHINVGSGNVAIVAFATLIMGVLSVVFCIEFSCIKWYNYCSICNNVLPYKCTICPPYIVCNTICTTCYNRRQIAREVSDYVNNVNVIIPNVILDYQGTAHVGDFEIPEGIILDEFPNMNSPNNKHDQDVCPICIDVDYREQYDNNNSDFYTKRPSDNMSLVLKCGHIMHIKCIKYDMKECPLCKVPTSPLI